MRRTELISGVTALALAVILYLLDLNKISLIAGNPNIIIYPAWFFTLLGAVLLFRALKSKLTA